MPGRSIRLFLVDGSPQGFRTAQVGNWNGLALICPRTDFARLVARPEAQKTGAYLLMGPSEASAAGLAVYVGEADNVAKRLKDHDDEKDFWTAVVVLVSKDDALTKAHVRWLEAALLRDLRDAKRAEVLNGTAPPGGRLPEADASDMETYLENARLLLATLGVNAFAPDRASPPRLDSRPPELILDLRWEDAAAACVVRDGQFFVQPGSTARVKEVDSLGNGSRALRATLRRTGVLAVVEGQPDVLKFTQEYAFESPSGAAAVVSGSNLNGRSAWKVRGSGISYKEWEGKQIAALERSEPSDS